MTSNTTPLASRGPVAAIRGVIAAIDTAPERPRLARFPDPCYGILHNSMSTRSLERALPGRGALDPGLVESLFDALPDVVFFTKDREGRYVLVNETLVERCGVKHKDDLRGRTVGEVFPAPLGATYAAQDRLVLDSGAELRDRLEAHLYPGGGEGWCLTYKAPLRSGGAIVGLVGISRDLHAPNEQHPEYARLGEAVERVRERFGEPLRVDRIAREVGLSVDRFERLARQVFHLTPRQLLHKTRLEQASRLLLSSRLPISEIAQACGYADQSAFTRRFRATVGLTPRSFRARARPDPTLRATPSGTSARPRSP
jgi:AraC-like DNA-binding protein/PAS domain-containing protein